MKPTFEYRDPTKLKNHPLSIELYGETLDEEFVESVRCIGRILEPLRILPDETVISGRRRRMAAVKLKIDKVPVVVERDLFDELDIQEQVILSNRPNVKTTEQRGREFVKLKQIEVERAERRMREAPIKARSEKKTENNGGKDAPQIFAGHLPGVVGDARKIAAEAVGMSHTTAEKVAEVVQKIDELEDKGQTKKANELRGKLETSVSAAHREIAPPKKPAKKKVGTDKGQLVRIMKGLMSQVVKCLDARGKDGNHAKCNKAINEFIREWEDWK